MTTTPATVNTVLKRYKVLTYIFGGAIVVYLIVSVFGVHVTTADSSTSKPDFPAGGPAEFLYLDTGRVAAYLAQVDGGSFDSEKLTHKLTDTLSGKLTIADAAEAGGSTAEEDFVEREVTPTAASSFFSLYAGLKKQHEVTPIRLRYFENDVRHLREGQFVSFQTTAMLSPIYLNPYLAARQANTLGTIFPDGKGERLTKKTIAERHAASRFVELVGETPRVVFSLHPEKEELEKPFSYLLPMSARELTEEQSLLKYGGGQFMVVGKVVRVFPEDDDEHKPAYVDSATLRTWEQPLRNAPGELLCRTDPRCAWKVHQYHLRGKALLRATKESRERALAALREQTMIGKRGAVIIPIAIYK